LARSRRWGEKIVAGKRKMGLGLPAFDLKATTSLCSIKGGWDSNLGTSYKKQAVQLYNVRCKIFRMLTSAASSIV
jgi:hypothetical protein